MGLKVTLLISLLYFCT